MSSDYLANRHTLHNALHAALQDINLAGKVIAACSPTFDGERDTVDACRREIIGCIKRLAIPHDDAGGRRRPARWGGERGQ